MGVTCSLSSATPVQTKALQAHPALVDVFLSGEPVGPPATWLQRLLRRTPTVPAELLEVHESMRTDLDKAWHGLHFLLTGEADEAPLPAGMLLGGGTPLAGGSHLLAPEQVRACHQYLSAVTDEQLAGAFDPARMDQLDIYPRVIWTRDKQEALEYLLANLQTLRAVLRDCSEEGHGLVITIE